VFENDFSRTSCVQIKLGIFVGSQIRELTKYLKLEDHLSHVEKAARKPLKISQPFLFFGGGDQRAENHRDLVADLVKSYKPMQFNTSLKVHFLDSHLDVFTENLREVSHENGE